MKYIVEGQLLVELLKMVDKKSNLLALLLKQDCVVGVFVYMELVEGAMDLGEFIKNVGQVKLEKRSGRRYLGR